MHRFSCTHTWAAFCCAPPLPAALPFRSGTTPRPLVAHRHYDTVAEIPRPTCLQPNSYSVRAVAQRGSVAARSTAAAAAVPEPPGYSGGVYTCVMQVRDYELDQFNVVNNAVYSSYFQHARHEAMAALGYSPDAFGRAGTPLALSEISIQFKAPLRSRDRFDVTVAVAKVGGARLVMTQRILLTQRDGAPTRQVVAEAEAVVVFLNATYQPARIPADVKDVFSRMVLAGAAAS